MSERADMLAQLQAAVDEVLGDEAPVLAEDTRLVDADIDSLDLVEVIMVIEDRDGIVVEGEALNDTETVGALIDVLLALRPAAG